MSEHSETIRLSRQTLYLAFRAAWLSAFHALVHDLANRAERKEGFFRHVPLLVGTAPQIQLQCLFDAWQRVCSEDPAPTTLDQYVCCAAMEELAWLGQIEHVRRLNEITAGPATNAGIDTLWLCSKIRSLQIALPARDDSSGVGAWTLLKDRLDQTDQPAAEQELLETVGRWRVSAEFVQNAAGLLTTAEMQTLQVALAEQPGMLNL